MGSRNGGWLLVVGFLVYASGLVWLCFLFVRGRVSGLCGLHILKCGWLSSCVYSCIWSHEPVI